MAHINNCFCPFCHHFLWNHKMPYDIYIRHIYINNNVYNSVRPVLILRIFAAQCIILHENYLTGRTQFHTPNNFLDCFRQ